MSALQVWTTCVLCIKNESFCATTWALDSEHPLHLYLPPWTSLWTAKTRRHWGGVKTRNTRPVERISLYLPPWTSLWKRKEPETLEGGMKPHTAAPFQAELSTPVCNLADRCDPIPATQEFNGNGWSRWQKRATVSERQSGYLCRERVSKMGTLTDAVKAGHEVRTSPKTYVTQTIQTSTVQAWPPSRTSPSR